MSTMIVDRSDPLSSTEFAAVDLLRIAEIAIRHKSLGDLIRVEQLDGILLQRPENLSWLTAGADFRRGNDGGTNGAIFVTPDSRVVVCSNVSTPQFFDEELCGFGFQLKERPWYEPRDVLLADLCRGRTVASDTGFGRTPDIGLRLTGLRLPLVSFDQDRLRFAGKLVAHAVEATARGLTSGRTENEIAGELSHRIMKHGGCPVRVQVLADGRAQRYRQWNHKDSPVTQSCTLSAVVRFAGLHIGCARTVVLGELPDSLRTSYERLAMVLATGMYFSQVDWELFEIWNRVRRIYEKTDIPDEWRLADQATVCEYMLDEIPLAPTSQFKLSSGVPVYWHPSVGAAMGGETVLVTERGAEVLTPPTDWPVLTVSVKGTDVAVPGLLQIV